MKDEAAYFHDFDLEESNVIKFEHLVASGEICLMFYLYSANDTGSDATSCKEENRCAYPYQMFHKLNFKGVENYERKGPISVHFKNVESFEEKLGENSTMLMYCVENRTFNEKQQFKAVLTGFGEISFNYAEMKYDSMVVIAKGLNGRSNEFSFIDVENGNVGLIPELFELRRFNIGDTVHLKSGGPDMTIKSLNEHIDKNLVNCIWFDSSNNRHTDEFPVELLEVDENRMSRKKFGSLQD